MGNSSPGNAVHQSLYASVELARLAELQKAVSRESEHRLLLSVPDGLNFDR
jgi:hypothetical protein